MKMPWKNCRIVHSDLLGYGFVGKLYYTTRVSLWISLFYRVSNLIIQLTIKKTASFGTVLIRMFYILVSDRRMLYAA